MTVGRRDAAALGALALFPLAMLSPTLFGPRILFVNDLTHVIHPWRVFTAELLQKGRVPLWNPYAFSGLPSIGNMQTGLFSPLDTIFHLFPFARALSPYYLLVFWLGTLLAYLQLRLLGARPASAAGGSLLMAAGGVMIVQMQFPNVFSTMAWGAGFLLFAGRPWLTAVAAGAGFLSGYPTLWVAWAGASVFAHVVFGGALRDALRSAAGLAAGLAVGALVAAPGFELARESGRAQERTMSPALRMGQSADLPDLLSVIHPELTRLVESRGGAPEVNRVAWTYGQHTTTFTFVVPAGREHVSDPAGSRYSHLASAYLGAFAAAAALAGLAALALRRPVKGFAAAAFVGGVLFLSLGSNHPVTAWLWTHAPYLKHLRGPARIMYWLMAVAPALAAAGLQAASRRRGARAWAALWIVAIALELGVTGWAFHPTQPRSYWTNDGPLVRLLRERADGLRFFMLPETDLWPQVKRRSDDPRFAEFRDVMYRTYKEKLFGISYAPFHLDSASGSYEPLVPAGVDAAVKLIRVSGRSRGLAGMLAWMGCRLLLAKDEVPPHLVGHEEALLPGRLIDRGTALWRVYETPASPARARWLPEEEAGRLQGSLLDAGEPPASAWEYRRPREDRFEAEGEAPSAGRLFLAEPYYPGWRAYVDGERKTILPALDGFLQVRVDGGRSRAVFVYRPLSWLLGVWTSLAALAALALCGFYRMTEA